MIVHCQDHHHEDLKTRLGTVHIHVAGTMDTLIMGVVITDVVTVKMITTDSTMIDTEVRSVGVFNIALSGILGTLTLHTNADINCT